MAHGACSSCKANVYFSVAFSDRCWFSPRCLDSFHSCSMSAWNVAHFFRFHFPNIFHCLQLFISDIFPPHWQCYFRLSFFGVFDSTVFGLASRGQATFGFVVSAGAAFYWHHLLNEPSYVLTVIIPWLSMTSPYLHHPVIMQTLGRHPRPNN